MQTSTATSTFTVTPLPSNTPTWTPTATQTLVNGLDSRIEKALDSAETDLRMQEMALSAVLIQQPGSVTIDYTYDGLYRLTDAEYSNGDYYRYTYDAVGNRLTQETIAETNTYTYDAANRMTSVDGVTYTWDANGNMLSDGVSTYTYDHANRLTGVTGTDVSSFVYNGLGDRYQQIVNGTTTTYQLDLAAGLVNVLADGENTYLYGNTVLAQVSDTQTGYYLPDVLGSVRQMTSSTGEVQLSQRFTPFGEVKEKFGNGEANFGYTAQKYDAQTGLLYLRARYYAPGMGRFISQDTWSGDANMPMSYNAWLYAYGNPVKYLDYSGFGGVPTYCLNFSNGAFTNAVLPECQNFIASVNQDLDSRNSNSDVTRPPAGITWNPKVYSLERNYDVGRTQDWIMNEDATGYEHNPNKYGFNLCGQISTAYVLSALTDTPLNLRALMKYVNILVTGNASTYNKNTTTLDTLAQAVEIYNTKHFYSHERHIKTSIYSYQNIYRWILNPWFSDIENDEYSFIKVPLMGSHQYGPDNPEYPKQISSQLSQGHYHIALVEMSKSTHDLRYVLNESAEVRSKYVTGHWIVVTGMSSQWDYNNIKSRYNWVKIYNPYNNRDEYYKWEYFRSYLHSATAMEMWY